MGDDAERTARVVEQAAHPFEKTPCQDGAAGRVVIQCEFIGAAATVVERVGINPIDGQSVTYDAGYACFLNQFAVVVELQIAFRAAFASGETVLPIEMVVAPFRKHLEIRAVGLHFRRVLLKPLATVKRQRFPLICKLLHLLFHIADFRQIRIAMETAPIFPQPCVA